MQDRLTPNQILRRFVPNPVAEEIRDTLSQYGWVILAMTEEQAAELYDILRREHLARYDEYKQMLDRGDDESVLSVKRHWVRLAEKLRKNTLTMIRLMGWREP